MSDKTTSLQPAFSRILIILTLLCAGVSIFLQAKWYIPVYDDSSYQYVLGEHPIGTVDNDYSRKVETLDDLIESQTNHYLYTNGRAVVHTIVQAVLAFGGWELVPWILSFMMIGTLIALIFYCYPGKMRENPLPWVLAAVVWLMMFPSPDGAFWRFIFAMNYLYPMLLCLMFFMIFRRLREGKRCHVAIAAIVAFLTGWSQEGFSIPLSGAILVYLFLHRREVDGRILSFAVFLWLGTLLMFVAPGNYVRVTNSKIDHFGGLMYSMLDGIYLILLHPSLLWIEIVAMLMLFWMSPGRFIKLFKEYEVLWFSFVFSVAFSILVHTSARSLMNAEFFGASIVLTLFQIVVEKYRISKRAYSLSAAVILVLMVSHQSVLLANVKKMYGLQKSFICEYKESTDGLVRAPVLNSTLLVTPWIFDWHTDQTKEYIYFTLTNDYGSNHKPLKGFREVDYNAIKNTAEFFKPANKVPGDSPFYLGDEYFFARLSELNSAEYMMFYTPVRFGECRSFYHFIKKLLFPHSFDMSETLVPTDTIKTVNDTLVIAPKPWRTVSEIQMMD